jgi:Mg2+/Co2+ transporter CorC
VSSENHTRAFFVGGPLDGQIIDTGDSHSYRAIREDGVQVEYIHNILRSKGLMFLVFTAGMMDAHSIIRAAMMVPEAAELWQPNVE